jgi:hypothetical protein
MRITKRMICQIGGSLLNSQGTIPRRRSPERRLFFKEIDTRSINKDNSGLEGNDSMAFIPRRGEKDFEPVATLAERQGLEQSEETTALLSEYQSLTLRESREALFSAISSGSRHHNSKAHNSFTWRGEIDGGRATCDKASTYGIHFATIGKHSTERKQLELYPEEALYLTERGVIELWSESVTESGDMIRVPMTVQQCWAQIIGHDELTLERFQASLSSSAHLTHSYVFCFGPGVRLPKATRIHRTTRTGTCSESLRASQSSKV